MIINAFRIMDLWIGIYIEQLHYLNPIRKNGKITNSSTRAVYPDNHVINY